jgi:maleylacetoacetate isomerase
MILYDYFRSSAAYRVRIAIELKGLKVERRPVHLARGEQQRPDYRAKNPLALVPTLELDDGTTLTQSLAIIDYLDAIAPQPPLLPAESMLAAKVRAVAFAIACDIHPLTNLRVTQYLESRLDVAPQELGAWRRRWILDGLEAVERLITPAAPFCFGATPSLADLCLIPQLFNARRFAISFEHLPRIIAVEARCGDLPAFRAAHPWAQADAQ